MKNILLCGFGDILVLELCRVLQLNRIRLLVLLVGVLILFCLISVCSMLLLGMLNFWVFRDCLWWLFGVVFRYGMNILCELGISIRGLLKWWLLVSMMEVFIVCMDGMLFLVCQVLKFECQLNFLLWKFGLQLICDWCMQILLFSICWVWLVRCGLWVSWWKCLDRKCIVNREWIFLLLGLVILKFWFWNLFRVSSLCKWLVSFCIFC